MAIQSFCPVYTPGYVSPNVTQRPYKTIELLRKTGEGSPPTERTNYMTAYTEAYRRWELSKREPIRPRDNLRVSSAKFQATTSYQDEYGLKNFTGPPSTYYKLSESQTFKGVGSYETAYTPSTVQQFQPSRHQRAQVLYKPNSAPFSGDSTYGHTYRIPQTEWPSSARPKAAGEGGLRFFGEPPQSKDEYVARPGPPEQKQKYTTTYSRPKGEMQFITSYAWDFRAWEIEKRAAILPRDQITKPTGPFMHSTSYLTEYTPKSQRSSQR